MNRIGRFGSASFRRFQRVGTEFFWILAGHIVSAAGMLLGVRILTEFVTPVTYGEVALGLTLGTLLSQLLFGPLAAAASRFFAPATESDEFSFFLVALLRLVAYATLITVVIACGVSFVLASSGRFAWFWIAALGFAILSGYNSILNGLQNAARQRLIVAWHQAVASWGRFVLAVVLVLCLGTESTAVMFGYVLAILVVLFSQHCFFKRTMRINGNEVLSDGGPSWETRLLRYAFPFSIWGIFTWGQLVSDRWALELLATTTDVGLYAVLFQVGYYPISTMTGVVVQLVSPIWFQRAGDASEHRRVRPVFERNKELSFFTLAVTSLIFLVVFFFHRQIFSVLVADEYCNVSHLFPWIVMSGGVFASGQILSLNLMTAMRTEFLLAPKIITAVAAIILNFTCSYYFGIKGVVFANLVFSCVYYIWVCLVNHKLQAGRIVGED